jgi:hypothetical protein
MTYTAKSFARLVLCSLFAAGVPEAAHATMIADTTQNMSYYGNSPINWFNGWTTSVGDAVEGGNDFDTNRVNVTTGTRTLQLDYYTQFDGDDLGAHYADIFLATGNDPDAFTYGIALGAQLAYGGVAKGLYALNNNYLTSIDRWGGTGYIYGGKYISPNDGQPHDAPTIITGGTALAGWTVDVSQGPSGDGTYPYLLSVKLSAANDQILKTVFSAANIAIMWGTGDCNNDSVYVASAAPSRSVPEPGTLILLFSAIVSAACIGWGRRGPQAA